MSQVRIFDDPAAAGVAVAAEIAALIRARAAEGRTTALGLATGTTPIPVYRELVRLHREQDLSFASVHSFNLDEYWPIGPEHPRSFRRFMRGHFVDRIDLDPARFHIPDGLTPLGELPQACTAYERAIADAGGLDYQVLGIGVNGHIGFNEPGTLAGSRTQLAELTEDTRRRAASAFGDEKEVPSHGVTMGVGTILEARRIVVLAFGQEKAGIVARTLASAPTPSIPATLLHGHPALSWVLDRAAAARVPDR